MDAREAANRAARDYIERTRKRLDDGQQELERQQASVRWLRDPFEDGADDDPTPDQQ
jgi:hypothetical protein